MRKSIVLLALLSGCAPQYQWMHAHGSKEQFDRDLAQCQYEAAQGTASYSQGQTSRTASGAAAQGFGEGLTIGARRNELGVLCMKARGYTQQAIP